MVSVNRPSAVFDRVASRGGSNNEKGGERESNERHGEELSELSSGAHDCISILDRPLADVKALERNGRRTRCAAYLSEAPRALHRMDRAIVAIRTLFPEVSHDDHSWRAR